MNTRRFQIPAAMPASQLHEVAAPERAVALYHALPGNTEVLRELRNKHIISAQPFNVDEILALFKLAAGYESGILPIPHLPVGSIMSNLFLDYTRPQIRLSFIYAWMKMGGTILNIEKTIQELMANRTEAYQEVAELCNINSDLAIVLSQHDGVLEEMLQYFTVPIINAGNGSGEHPSHALADLYTIFKWQPELLAEYPAKPLHIAVYGDPSYTRTIRSFLYLLTKFPRMVERIVIMDHADPLFKPGQREELTQAGLSLELVSERYPRESSGWVNRTVLPGIDVIYVHELVSKEVLRPNIVESIASMKPNALVLNPEIQLQEYANLLNNSAHNGYFTQARGASFVRIALLHAIMAKD